MQLAYIGQQNAQHKIQRATQCKGIQLTKRETGRTVENVEQWKRLTCQGRTQEGKSESGVERGTEEEETGEQGTTGMEGVKE